MNRLRKSEDRGKADHGWLKSRHSFSFGEYHDPKHMGFGVLRVINEDRVEGGQGFGTHPHQDMEIISYVISGALAHKDTLGNNSVIKPGEFQYMSAGTGVQHSEFNPSKSETAHFLQIWIFPDKKGYAPRYGQKSFENDLAEKDLVLVASQSGKDGSLAIHQDVNLYAAKWKVNKAVTLNVGDKRKIWIQLISGKITANDIEIAEGDGLSFQEENKIQIKGNAGSQFLLFDLSH